ncbi:MAG: T9SS type A sorting domain-containing protein, partial [Dysgonomonas sp.]
MPLVNAGVVLQNTYGTVIWRARTDNTGKAELWAGLYSESKEDTKSGLKLVFDYEGKSVEIASAKPFSEGINTAKIDAVCGIQNAVDIFFMVDATGSMGDEIRYLQIELNDIIKKIKKQQSQLQLRVGSLVYRDNGDEYVTRKSSLDADVNTTLSFLKDQRAGGGGDYPEAVDEALYQTIYSENWNDAALARIAFLVLDAPAHDDASSQERVKEQIRLAAEKGIRIVPIVCSGMAKDGEYLMRCMALATNGTYLFLTDDSGVGDSHMKPTTDSYDVEKMNDAIVRIVKQYTQMPDCSSDKWIKEQKKQSDADKFVPNPSDEDPDDDVKTLGTKAVMKVYPNPCKELLKVDIKKDVEELFFVDMTGKSLQSFKPSKNETIETDVQSYAAGVYFIKALYKGKWFTEKVIVTK